MKNIFHVIIPARYTSTRLPGKPLADVAGKPLIQRVYECAAQSGAQSVTIATDDERIRAAAERFGANVCLTTSTHRSGTDRLAEAIEKLSLSSDDIVVNLQGDEPQLDQLSRLAFNFNRRSLGRLRRLIDHVNSL